MPAPRIPPHATVAELEGVLKLSRTQLYKHIRKANLEPDERRRYDTRKVMDAILRHRADDNRLKGHGELKAKKLSLETSILETRLAELEGKLVDSERAARDRFQDFRSIRDAFLGLSDRVSDQIAAERDGHRVARLLEDEIRAILSRQSIEIEERADASLEFSEPAE